ncbi:helix-turn-helix domain-containing protein [Amphritea sp.]|uniref:helix-turn-helix domain-containing protein n=1 Tax=Amphritea sp. TaxID=1872502 RepID=UPI0025B82F65|nr:helix-turn-helix domain-containing protein [Amphritea sp.]
MAQCPNIPTVQIYGEKDQQVTPDLLHCEPLITRSRAHQFSIRPHRHHGLSQIFYLKNGSGEANLDGDPTTIKGPCLIVISEMCVHDFLWSDDVSGYVLSIANPLLDNVGAVIQKERPVIKSTLIMTVRREQKQLESILELIQFEYNQSVISSRSEALGALVQILCIWLERNAVQRHFAGNSQDKKSEYLNRFSDLINRDFIQHRKVESYAKELGITAPYLNNLCQQLIQRSALHMVHNRLLLEAKRHLIYTVLSINEIAYELGFNDPAYFNRFFKRLSGLTPKQFRVKTINSSDLA